MLHMLPRILFKIDIDIEKAFKEYLMHFLYLYDGLVYVDINPEVVLERLKKRFLGKSEIFKKSRADIYDRARKQSKMLRHVITSQTIVPYLVIDGSDETYKNAQRVVSFVNQKIMAT